MLSRKGVTNGLSLFQNSADGLQAPTIDHLMDERMPHPPHRPRWILPRGNSESRARLRMQVEPVVVSLGVADALRATRALLTLV